MGKFFEDLHEQSRLLRLYKNLELKKLPLRVVNDGMFEGISVTEVQKIEHFDNENKLKLVLSSGNEKVFIYDDKEIAQLKAMQIRWEIFCYNNPFTFDEHIVDLIYRSPK